MIGTQFTNLVSSVVAAMSFLTELMTGFALAMIALVLFTDFAFIAWGFIAVQLLWLLLEYGIGLHRKSAASEPGAVSHDTNELRAKRHVGALGLLISFIVSFVLVGQLLEII
ncbi:hypothetical protein [Yoonia sp. I 8.24]|uniref:hypothetical protein n=1 Tax=Yoonia sp. I 8.24 TaxID=1537229 RepID=UPI001EDFB85F|nr:hypothetical protein [Yoonia sp. I 8.24]MCG3268788.1 hypothetical protein [Yoonia sp. I 8.24]